MSVSSDQRSEWCQEGGGSGRGDTGELGEHESSEDEDSEMECERPLLEWMGMGLECSEDPSGLEDMVGLQWTCVDVNAGQDGERGR